MKGIYAVALAVAIMLAGCMVSDAPSMEPVNLVPDWLEPKEISPGDNPEIQIFFDNTQSMVGFAGITDSPISTVAVGLTNLGRFEDRIRTYKLVPEGELAQLTWKEEDPLVIASSILTKDTTGFTYTGDFVHGGPLTAAFQSEAQGALLYLEYQAQDNPKQHHERSPNCGNGQEISDQHFDLIGLDRITSAVNTAAWIPMIGYIISALFQMIKFSKRFDQQSFQPLKKPFGLMVTFIVQVVIFVFSRPASNRGQASIAFVSAMVVVLVMSVIVFSASMVWGRPIPGRTEMPFSNSN